jgi:hypothetical protein
MHVRTACLYQCNLTQLQNEAPVALADAGHSQGTGTNSAELKHKHAFQVTCTGKTSPTTHASSSLSSLQYNQAHWACFSSGGIAQI